MAHINNEIWLSDAYSNFQQAVAESNYSLAKDIIGDVHDKGFVVEAKALEELLQLNPLSKFAVVSPY